MGVAPALTATLPGQPNPYAYELLLGKASAYIHPVRNASGSPWTGGEVYYPLTIVSSMTSTITSTLPATAVLSGTVRNDSGLPLHLARVVTITGKCHWRETRLDTRTLLAGQGTGFYLRDVSACLDDKMMIVGQAAAGP